MEEMEWVLGRGESGIGGEPGGLGFDKLLYFTEMVFKLLSKFCVSYKYCAVKRQ